MRYVLDTNIVVAALNGDPSVVHRLNRIPLHDPAILPAVALGELRYGALSSQRVAENLSKIDRLFASLVFAPVDRAVAERFGALKALLRRQGVIKSDADLLIKPPRWSWKASSSLTTKPCMMGRSRIFGSRIGSLLSNLEISVVSTEISR